MFSAKVISEVEKVYKYILPTNGLILLFLCIMRDVSAGWTDVLFRSVENLHRSGDFMNN